MNQRQNQPFQKGAADLSSNSAYKLHTRPAHEFDHARDRVRRKLNIRIQKQEHGPLCGLRKNMTRMLFTVPARWRCWNSKQ